MEIFRWLSWQWRQFETWQKAWIVGCMFVGASIGTNSERMRMIYLAVPITIFLCYTFKWWIYEPAMNSWKEYKKQKETLFDTIRGDKD